jgi:hypothetical protein
MSFLTPSNLELAIIAQSCTMRPGVDHTIRHGERVMKDALTEIVKRAELLLAQLDSPDTAWHAVHEAASAAGASGPIGSQWEKVVVAAAGLRAAALHGTDHVAREV